MREDFKIKVIERHVFNFLNKITPNCTDLFTVSYCQTLGLVLTLRVDFVLPLSQEEQEQEQEEEEPPTKIYQKGEC